jgi:plastocyanin
MMLLAGLAIGGCGDYGVGGEDPPAPDDGAGQVEIRLLGGNSFEPAAVTVAPGTEVTWTWVGGFHDVTSAGEPAFTGSGEPAGAPRRHSVTFDTPGTYVYFCSVHGSPTGGMRGTIIVR